MHRISNRIAAALIMAAVFVGTAHAGARVNTSSGLTPAGAPLALRGYDPVAYFKAGRPVPGKSQFSLVWRGATWRFADADAMEAFEMNPKGYAPEYGGYCAYAMSKGAVAPTVPDAFTVYDGRLYLNYSLDVRTTWKQDIPGNLKKGATYWPEVLPR